MNYLHRAGFPIYRETSVRYFDLGDKFFPALIEDMRKAEKFIFLEFFILSEGSLWQQLLEVLQQKAAAGVDVRILYDDFGCITCLPKRFEQITKEAGIRTAVFNKIKPIVNNFYLNYRNHQKICIIDGNIGYTGGVNICLLYTSFSDGKLNSLIREKDTTGRFVLETFVKFGAPEEILYRNKPHIGTDNLRKIVKNIREYLIGLGAEIRFGTRLDGIADRECEGGRRAVSYTHLWYG